MSRKIKIIMSVIAAGVAVAGGIIYSKAIKSKPADDASVKLIRFDNVRTQRYTEILPIWGNGLTKKFVAGVYNTVGLNSPTGTGDSSPQEIPDKVAVEQVKKVNNAPAAIKNGPRLWALDWIEVNAGAIRDFSGLKAHWVMWFDVPPEMVGHEGKPYHPLTGKRNTHLGINKGSPAFLLDDPEGNS